MCSLVKYKTSTLISGSTENKTNKQNPAMSADKSVRMV